MLHFMQQQTLILADKTLSHSGPRRPETLPQPEPAAGPPATPPPQRHAELSRRHLCLLWLAAGLAVLPSLPFLESDTTAFVRLHNWAIFAGGIGLGWVLASARASLR